MNILLAYGESINTTGNYFKKAFEKRHNVSYIGDNKNCPDINQYISKLSSKPDVFIYIDGLFILPRGIEKLDCPTVCYLIDVHIDLKIRREVSKFFDYIFIAQKDYIEEFKILGNKNVFWLPLACDQDIHKELKLDRIYDIGFVGHLGAAKSKRSILLEKLSRKYKMNDFKSSVPFSKISEVYSQSKIAVNIAAKGDLNMRVFEVMAAGTLLLTEKISNGQDELFEDKKNLIYYDENTLMELIDYYLKNVKERERIAKVGQELVLSEYTYEIRANKILSIIEEGSKKECSILRNASKSKISYVYFKIYARLRLLGLLLKEFLRYIGVL